MGLDEAPIFWHRNRTRDLNDFRIFVLTLCARIRECIQ